MTSTPGFSSNWTRFWLRALKRISTTCRNNKRYKQLQYAKEQALENLCSLWMVTNILLASGRGGRKQERERKWEDCRSEEKLVHVLQTELNVTECKSPYRTDIFETSISFWKYRAGERMGSGREIRIFSPKFMWIWANAPGNHWDIGFSLVNDGTEMGGPA